MSFGFGVGDFIAVGTLAWKLYRACKGMKDEWFEMSRETLTVHTILQELQDETRDKQSVLNVRGAPRRAELMMLIANLEKVLQELDDKVTKYQGLARRERRIWNQLRLASEDLDQIRARLTFHMTAINGFMDSLSRGTLARMEPVLLEILREVREGRRPPSLVSIDEPNDVTGWKELEKELAEDGISGADIIEHKAAIRIFILGRLKDPTTDNISLDDVASVVESDIDKGSILDRMTDAKHPWKQSSKSDETFVTAHEVLSRAATAEEAALQVSFAPFHRVPDQVNDEPDEVDTIDKRLALQPYEKQSERSIYRYRHSVDVSALSPTTTEPPQKVRQMVLLIDPTHSSVSKLAHAYLRHLIVNHRAVGEEVDTVRSTGWRMHESGGIDILSLDTLIKGLLARRKIEVPKPTAYNIAPFRFADLLQFDHIIYFNSPAFGRYLEENIQKIAKVRGSAELEDREFAQLTPYEMPSTIQLPDDMSMGQVPEKEATRNRQRLALEEVFRMVQRFLLDFLLREYGLKKTGQGFEKLASHRRPSKASLPSLGRVISSASST